MNLHLPPAVAKTQQFIQQHERETLLISRCVIGVLVLSLLTMIGLLVYTSFFG